MTSTFSYPSPRFMFMWPNSRISVMGGEQAAGVLATVKGAGMKRAGKEWTVNMENEFKRKTVERYDEEGSPYFSSARWG